MGYPSLSPLNKQFRTTNLSNTAQEVFSATSGSFGGTDVDVIHLRGGAAAEVVIFRAVDDSPEYFRVSLAIGEEKWLLFPKPVRFASDQGLEVITADAAGDVTVELYYHQPGAKGIGV
jgi:hypothetical protein